MLFILVILNYVITWSFHCAPPMAWLTLKTQISVYCSTLLLKLQPCIEIVSNKTETTVGFFFPCVYCEGCTVQAVILNSATFSSDHDCSLIIITLLISHKTKSSK